MPLRCLLFSSDESLVPLIWPVLADLGIEGEHCGNAVEAVERVTTQLFQIVITDWDDQPEAEFLLKTSRERKAAVRPLTLAIVKDDASRPLALQAGANSILRKPLVPAQVRDTLGTARDLLRAKLESATPAVRPAATTPPPAAFAAAASASPAATPTVSQAARASNAFAPIFVPAAATKAPEESFRAGEFLQPASSRPGKQFDNGPDEAESVEQASAAQLDPLTELEPMAAAVESVPEPPPPEALKGWASVTERLAKVRQVPVQAPAPKTELLSYENSHSISAPADAAVESDPAQSAPLVDAPPETKAEAELFAYIGGESTEHAEPEVANPPPNRKARFLVVGAVAVVSIVALVKVPAAQQAMGRLFGSATHAGKSWLNPQPVPQPQVPAQHENFGQADDEYKFPVAGTIPDAATDASQIRVLPVVDPTAKPANGSAANAGASQPAVTDNNSADQSLPGQVQNTPGQVSQTQGAEQSSQNAGATIKPGNQSGTFGSPAVAAPQVQVNLPVAQIPSSRPVSPPVQSASQPHAASVASNAAIPSSLRSQMASMTPDAGGNKPVEAALPSIQPVNLPEATARGLLLQQADPVYPDSAKNSRQQGTVVLQVLIAGDGSVQDAKFLQGSLVFARSAIEAVRQWRFKPYVMNGRPAAAQTVLTISFRPPA